MKRLGYLYNKISTYENLRVAFLKAVKGKHDRQEVIAFRNNFENEIEKLKDQIENHAPDIGHYHFFRVYDPKRRLICAASFPERVLHHAIMNICEPILDAYAIYDSYACRKGKGLHKCLHRAQGYCRRFDWFLKMDIRRYFDSIDHMIALRLLSRRFKDRELLLLFQRLLDTYHIQTGQGVPIGNLISQHLANFYLGPFDHWIKEELGVKGYVRYMDDFLVFGGNKNDLKIKLDRIRAYLKDQLKLELKENVQLNRCKCGIPFLGMRVFPNVIRLSRPSKQRFSKKFRYYEHQWIKGKWSEKTLARRMTPLVQFTKAANTNDFRRSIIQRFGVLS